jgi:Mrp family chromosome partitioning ATPase
MINQQIEQILGGIIIPDTGLSLNQLNLIREVKFTDDSLRIVLASTGLNEVRQKWLDSQIRELMKSFRDISRVEIDFKEIKPAELNQVRHIIAVISGKGGVGKSVVSSLLAVSLSRKGYSVGVLDADLTGPSIPHIFGLNSRIEGTESAMLPSVTKSGIGVMSLNLLLPEEDEAVIWRGPVITGVIRQFWEGVLWGKRDFIIVDLPPGTADAPLTVLQHFPVTGIVLVFTPQALTAMIVKKTVKMAQKMEKPVLGVVENMSYLFIPETHKQMEIFGPSKADEMVEIAQAPLLARLPIDPVLTKLCDEGLIERYRGEAVEKLGGGLVEAIENLEEKEDRHAPDCFYSR